jgi:hypothetical protein
MIMVLLLAMDIQETSMAVAEQRVPRMKRLPMRNIRVLTVDIRVEPF